MKIRLSWFNSYLLLLALALGTGCKSAGRRHQDKLAATFRLHLEASPRGGESTAVIQIAGVELYVNDTPFLDERSITNAAVVDTRDGGFAIRVQCARAQSLCLPTANRALFDPKGEERFFVGTAGKPWTTGTFGCVRSEGRQMHEGLDIKCLRRDSRGEPTDPVMASADGTVVYLSRK